MIYQGLEKYQKIIAATMLSICFNTMVLPLHVVASNGLLAKSTNHSFSSSNNTKTSDRKASKTTSPNKNAIGHSYKNNSVVSKKLIGNNLSIPSIGGPSQPEMSAFKSIGTDDMVNLFTGDFSYNIPLLDVGGYPVNIFYDGGVSMEQEASWVGLGWNINPGNVNRNMRGVPDDFDGDEMKQKQQIKPNKTWGVNVGADAEILGIEGLSVGATSGISFNNYLGPALEYGVRGNMSVSLVPKVASKESPMNLNLGIGLTASSRGGTTVSPSASLDVKLGKSSKEVTTGFGVSASTSYNSRTGIKALQISEQFSFNKENAKGKNELSVLGNMTRMSTTINFAKPSYVPALRMPVTNENISVKGSADAEVYKQVSEVDAADVLQTKPMIGYLYAHKAEGNANAVMDFTRFNDNEVTSNTPIISVPQYSYDVFSIQGEGTGGSIRAYRNDFGSMRDATIMSKDKSDAFGADVDPVGYYGANYNTNKTSTVATGWRNGNNLKLLGGFQRNTGTIENVYFRNPGETSVLRENEFAKIGGTDLVNFRISGDGFSPVVNPVLEKYNKEGLRTGTSINVAATSGPTTRKKRTQVISFLTAQEASIAGLDKVIKNYNATNVLNSSNDLEFSNIARFNANPTPTEYRKAHHISQINVTESSGQRYIYGIPVYNITQKDFTFTVTNPVSESSNLVSTSATEAETLHTGYKDGYIQTTTTPAYAHSFLLSGLLSPDYVDVTGNGITEDDLGTAVKFNYSKSAETTKWATPITKTGDLKANFNKGKNTESKDDKGVISYGERESWYLHSIESKTLIAIFTTQVRNDAKSVSGELQLLNAGSNAAKSLKQIDLYSKADLKKNGLTAAKPIKTVHFIYGYELCSGTPDNAVNTGKLTLKEIYFTFNKQARNNKNKYVFNYGDFNSTIDNPNYEAHASDRWGTYKPNNTAPNSLKNWDYPYTKQDVADKVQVDQNASAWLLKKILLPSGGQMEITYEADDYAYVQNKRASNMMQLLGFGKDANSYNNSFYDVTGFGKQERMYAFIKVPEACSNKAEVFKKYLKNDDGLPGIEQLSFKFSMQMPKGQEMLNAYGSVEGNEYGVYANDPTNKTIWVKLQGVNGFNPLAITALEFLREQLPGQAYEGYDVSDETGGLQQIGDALIGMLSSLKEVGRDANKVLRDGGKARYIDVQKSFVRLNDPDGFKYGGGYRVKSVRLKDNWKRMNDNQLYTSMYGQDYDYTTTEVFNGTTRTISSGVAAYEPSIGGDENPFQSMVQVEDKLPLGPASHQAIEMPILDAFFPAPTVGYSKITVRSIKKGLQDPTKKSRSGVGKQVTEYFTAKDYPVYYNYTKIDPACDLQAQTNSSTFWYSSSFDARALTQGFLVATNDMHGKMKSQASYAENDEKTPINFTRNFYRNTGVKGLDEKFDFVYQNEGGIMREGNMGIDIELMTDTREFAIEANSLSVQGQVSLFPIVLPIWLPFIWGSNGEASNYYRAVTTTKVISYHSVLDSIVVIDKGSMISTKNLVYDAETGEVVVSRTNNEFKKPIYNTKYLAYWAYSGMGLAYKNIDAVYRNVDFRDGKITNSNLPLSDLESGDELVVIRQASYGDFCATEALNTLNADVIWAFDKNKPATGLTSTTTPDFYFLDKDGRLYSKQAVTCKIIRSGKRNMLSADVASAITMEKPIVNNKLVIDASHKVINATAMHYKEKWRTDRDIIKKYKEVYNAQACENNEVVDCDGYLDRKINPYTKGLLGVFRSDLSKVFYGSRIETNPVSQTAISKNGFLQDFSLYWNFSSTNNNLIPDEQSSKWVWNSRITKFNAKGMELETKDALGIYTAAQYGYNKSMPVAIAKNSPYSQMFSENFEDGGFNESVNGMTPYQCPEDHIELNNIPNTQLVNNVAHSGSGALQINSTVSKLIPIGGVYDEANFNLDFTTQVTGSLYDLGANLNGVVLTPTNALNSYAYFPSSQTSGSGTTTAPGAGPNNFLLKVYPKLGTINNPNTYRFDFSFYINIPVTGTYRFNSYLVSEDPVGANTPVIASNTILKNLVGDVINSSLHINQENVNSRSKYYDYDLCKGRYQVEFSASGSRTISPVDVHEFCIGWYNLNASFTAPVTGAYKTLNTQNTCTVTKPILGMEDMLNPNFSIPFNTKMWLSAWVKQTCNTPCPLTDYTNSNIEVWSNGQNLGATTIKRVGGIIDGWQKVEGEFTVPLPTIFVGPPQVELRFVNNAAQPMYVDDIRIHPYNANVKSYVYDPVNLRLVGELDENNYTKFYEYDAEGTLIRTKAETKEGIKMITETRSAKQKTITTIE
jgi:hypothetical protein